MPTPGEEARISLGLGQNMYTPSNIDIANPPLSDHPYGAYLYGTVGLIAKTRDQSGVTDRLDQLQIQFGMIGPSALGKQAQTFSIHSAWGIHKPKGWGAQLRDEPGLVINYERSWRYSFPLMWGFEMQADPHVGAALGNVYDYVNVGAMARLGFDLPDDFGPVRVDPGLPGSSYFETKGNAFGGYLFAGIDGRAIARNIFLDGNSWAASRSVAKNIFVGDLQYGAAITLYSWRLTYTHVFRTREFKTQIGPDQFGALSLSYAF